MAVIPLLMAAASLSPLTLTQPRRAWTTDYGPGVRKVAVYIPCLQVSVPNAGIVRVLDTGMQLVVEGVRPGKQQHHDDIASRLIRPASCAYLV